MSKKEETPSQKLKNLKDLRATVLLGISQSENARSTAKEAFVKFQGVLLELKEKISKVLSLDIVPIDEFRKLKANIKNVNDYLKIQKAKIFSCINERKIQEKELISVEKEIAFLENTLEKRGQLLEFK